MCLARVSTPHPSSAVVDGKASPLCPVHLARAVEFYAVESRHMVEHFRRSIERARQARSVHGHKPVEVNEGPEPVMRCQFCGVKAFSRKWFERCSPKPEPEPVAGWVYYVETGGYIKIGWTSDLQARMRAYPPSFRLLAVEPGEQALEARRHRQFAVHRTHGREWYPLAAVLTQHVDRILAEHGEPPKVDFAGRPVQVPMPPPDRPPSALNPAAAVAGSGLFPFWAVDARVRGQAEWKSMSALVTFLRARLDEDETWAKSCEEVYPGPWEVIDRGHSVTIKAAAPLFRVIVSLDQDDVPPSDRWLSEWLDHIARHDPVRVLRDVAAKRVLVDHAEQVLLETTHRFHPAYRFAVHLLHTLGAVYADHPDYQPEWSRPMMHSEPGADA